MGENSPNLVALGESQGCQIGIFSKQKNQFGLIFDGLKMENVGIISVHLEYFPAIWDTYFKAYR
jgi:hypothetical protein